MENSINYSREATIMEHEQCSEKKCITCFENRGCMYEQNIAAAIHNIEMGILGSGTGESLSMGRRA